MLFFSPGADFQAPAPPTPRLQSPAPKPNVSPSQVGARAHKEAGRAARPSYHNMLSHALPRPPSCRTPSTYDGVRRCLTCRASSAGTRSASSWAEAALARCAFISSSTHLVPPPPPSTNQHRPHPPPLIWPPRPTSSSRLQQVRVGTHQVSGEEAALKFLDKASIANMGAAERTTTEIQCLTALRHPNIIRLLQQLESPNHVVSWRVVRFGGSS